jgi:hypothetical protein
MNAPATAAAPTTEKAKGAAPVLRAIARDGDGWKEVMVLWATAEDATAKLKGFVMVGGRKANVLGFVNTKAEDGSKFIVLSETTEAGLQRLATGNAINSLKDGGEVFFDTIKFKAEGADDKVYARLTNAATPELAAELGFTSARVPRPEQAQAEQAEEAAAERPRA